MNKQAKSKGIVILIVILIIFFVWGFVGGQQAQSVGVTCDFGIGDSLCWKWHTNVIGQTGEAIKDLFGR